MKELPNILALLDDDLLIKTLKKALSGAFEPEFLQMVIDEINRRDLELPASGAEPAE